MNVVARLVLVLALLVAPFSFIPTRASAQTTCPAVAPLLNSWQNLTYPAGVSSIFDRIGANKTINYGWGPSNLSGEPSGYGYANFHHGIDTNAVYEKIYAPFSGTAYQISPSGWAGALIIKLVLPNGRYFYFAHLSDQIASGPVKVGDILALTGNTGYSTGPHLHTQFMEADGSAIPPEQWACKSGGAGVTPGSTTASTDETDTPADGALVAPWVVPGEVLATSSAGTITVGPGQCNWCTVSRPRPAENGSVSITQRDTGSSSVRGLMVRYVDKYNWVGLMYYSGSVGLYKSVETTRSAIGSPISGSVDAGDVLRVSVVGNVLTAYKNGTQVDTATTDYLAGNKNAGFYTANYTAGFSGYAYTEKADGTATVPATTPDTTNESEGTSSWNPMVWLWNKVKGILIPSPEEWQEVAAEFGTLAEKEPIGTMRDVAGFASSTKAQMIAPAGGGAAPSVSGATGGGLWGWFSFSTVWVSMMDAGQWFASIIEGVTLGGMNALQLVKLATDAFLMWGLVLMISRKVKFAA